MIIAIAISFKDSLSKVIGQSLNTREIAVAEFNQLKGLMPLYARKKETIMDYDFNSAFRAIDHDLSANHSQTLDLIQALRTEVWLLHEELRELRLCFGFPESKNSAHFNLHEIAREALAE